MATKMLAGIWMMSMACAGGFAASAQTPTTAALPAFDSWVEAEAAHAKGGLLANISPAGTKAGAVVASPSRREPDYFFHWTRDAALVMDVVAGWYSSTTDAAARQEYAQLLDDYVRFSRGTQTTGTPSGDSSNNYAGYGEPKFLVNGQAFVDPWGRPQNDGPALRAITLVRYIKAARAQGNNALLPQLYNSDARRSVLKSDLEFVYHHWQDTGFDLWEEVRGRHFYTALVQRRALLAGADIAELADDPGAAGAYREKAQAIERSLSRFWDDRRGLLLTTLDRDGGVDYKASNIDASVVLAALHTVDDDGFMQPTDERILATAHVTEQAFRPLYRINTTVARAADGTALAPAIGRYPEDRYDGIGNSEGHPWVLLSAAFAELYYRAAQGFTANGEIHITAVNAAFFNALKLQPALNPGDVFASGDRRFPALIAALNAKGDSHLRRLQAHTPVNGALSEQFSRYDGYMRGAADLTWSYAGFLTAVAQRP